MPLMWPLHHRVKNPVSTYVDTADRRTTQTTVLKNGILLRTKKVHLGWISTAPVARDSWKGCHPHHCCGLISSVGDQGQLDGYHDCQEKNMTMESHQQKENTEREFKMQEQMMNVMTAVMNRFPDGGSGTRGVAPSITAFASHDQSAAGGGDTGGCDDDDSDKEN
ncbi:hypothetical protein MHU86_23831 [Fragilaria crotonensis]|nr:hypothetical protein MHU86_23831 [Fragilaria crotonensis]